MNDDFLPNIIMAGANLRATSVVWEWVRPKTRAIVWPPAFALVLPYLYLRVPRRFTRDEIKAALSKTAMDPAILAGLLVGSVRERTLVL